VCERASRAHSAPWSARCKMSVVIVFQFNAT
jgi:hypothetical protein